MRGALLAQTSEVDHSKGCFFPRRGIIKVAAAKVIAASILVARKWDRLGARPSPALDAAITDAISLAERIMQKIDSRSPPLPQTNP